MALIRVFPIPPPWPSIKQILFTLITKKPDLPFTKIKKPRSLNPIFRGECLRGFILLFEFFCLAAFIRLRTDFEGKLITKRWEAVK